MPGGKTLGDIADCGLSGPIAARHIEPYLFPILDNKATLNRMRNIMPARPPAIIDATAKKLESLGQQIRAHRKALRVSATTAAEAAGMSRVTLHRIEHGEPAVTMGAYLNAMAALGLDFGIVTPPNPDSDVSDDHRKGWIPARIHLPDYPQLKQLAWQVHGTDELTPVEALDIYERNGRHLDFTAMEPGERHLIDALRLAFGEGVFSNLGMSLKERRSG